MDFDRGSDRHRVHVGAGIPGSNRVDALVIARTDCEQSRPMGSWHPFSRDRLLPDLGMGKKVTDEQLIKLLYRALILTKSDAEHYGFAYGPQSICARAIHAYAR